MRVFYSDHFRLPLDEKHRFPNEKYQLLREKLLTDKVLSSSELEIAPLANQDLLAEVHCPKYVSDVFDGRLSKKQIREIGFPWSQGLVRKVQATVGGALAAAQAAKQDGLSGNLAGGTHHAHYDRGAGFCVFNDFAVVCHQLLKQNPRERIAIIDLDVHHGDGNATMLRANPQVFVFSLHGEKNYPTRKPPGDLDVGVADDISGDAYLEVLRNQLKVVSGFEPTFLLYQAGVDSLREDYLGRLQLSASTLLERDEEVFYFAKKKGLPLSMGLGGGYSRPIFHSVNSYTNTYRAAKTFEMSRLSTFKEIL